MQIKAPVGAGLGGVAGRLVDEVGAAAPRVADTSDPEGLHDLRVALRRLRVLLKVYGGYPEGRVRKRVLRSLRDLARATGVARDLEVTLAWVDSARGAPSRSPAIDRWHAELSAATGAARRELLPLIDRDLPPLLAQLRDTVAAFGRRRPVSGPFGGATAQRVQREAERLARELGAITGARQVEAVHRARIRGKHVRYLLAPWRDVCPACTAAEVQLKRLQDLLGEMHDCHVRVTLLAERAATEAAALARARVLAAAGGRRPPGDDGQAALLALAAENRRQLHRLFAAARREFLADHGAALLAAVERARVELAA